MFLIIFFSSKTPSKLKSFHYIHILTQLQNFPVKIRSNGFYKKKYQYITIGAKKLMSQPIMKKLIRNVLIQ